MRNEKTKSKPKTATQQETGGDCPCASYSASSDTPETNKELLASADTMAPGRLSVDFCRKLERQRNAAWKTLKEICELFTADESFGATVEALFAKPLEDAEAEIARLQSLLNAERIHGGAEPTNQPETPTPLDGASCSQCAERRQLADDALNTLRITREKYGIGDRHVMREKNREIEKLRNALKDATELFGEIMRDEVNHQDEAEKWLRAYREICPANAESIRAEIKP